MTYPISLGGAVCTQIADSPMFIDSLLAWFLSQPGKRGEGFGFGPISELRALPLESKPKTHILYLIICKCELVN